MAQCQLKPRPVQELLPLGFYIPPYQRGYRWRTAEVESLLEDIASFTPKQVDDGEARTWYCLQPLVVRPCDEETVAAQNLNRGRAWFEVIDGQQRLTTVYLILHYLNRRYVEEDRRRLFELRYATRERSAEFLATGLDPKQTDTSSIDFYHISTAYQTVCRWMAGKDAAFDKYAFESKLLFDTKIIWYESQEPDPIAVFTRINVGKIPLTNAELVKALFLNGSNFRDKDAERIRLRQLEIAKEWDQIEHELHNEAFWYFIGNGESHTDTRIEFILDLAAEPGGDGGDFRIFNFFWKRFKKCSADEVEANWATIKGNFQILKEWFEDRELYHKVGFLVADGEPVGALLVRAGGSSKTAFRTYLKGVIAEKVKAQLHKLEYRDPKVKKILLLHNIQTMLNNSLETSYFPFDRYKKENWDIEHVHSVKELMPQAAGHQQDWLNEAAKYVKDQALSDRITSFSGDDFAQLYGDVLDYFSADQKRHEDVNNLSNLALLDSGTNRGYKNAVFPVKRGTIIDKDRAGTFIPICTRNVFVKYYTKSVDQATLWGEQDRTAYLDDICTVLAPYLPVQENGGAQ